MDNVSNGDSYSPNKNRSKEIRIRDRKMKRGIEREKKS